MTREPGVPPDANPTADPNADQNHRGLCADDHRASARIAAVLGLVPPSAEPPRSDTRWVPRRKRSFDLSDLYGDRE